MTMKAFSFSTELAKAGYALSAGPEPTVVVRLGREGKEVPVAAVRIRDRVIIIEGEPIQ